MTKPQSVNQRKLLTKVSTVLSYVDWIALFINYIANSYSLYGALQTRMPLLNLLYKS